MMSIWIGKDSTSVKNIRVLFQTNFKMKYLKDPLIEEALLYIDGCILSEDKERIWSPVYGWAMSPDYFSDGLKCIIVLYIIPNGRVRPNLVICGRNCSKSLARLSMVKDFIASISNCTMDFAGYGIKELDAICENDGRKIKTPEDWYHAMLDFYETAER